MAKRRRDSIFNRLVLNAIDFSNRSVRELSKSPKYSMIHFAAAVELFLKARLLREHWSLIVRRPQEASLTRFQSGQFQSVTMEEAIDRLRNIANAPISNRAAKAFRVVRDHRNRLVHFFHADMTAGKATSYLEEIVSDECHAWHFLNELVNGPWRSHFRHHSGQLNRLDKTMRRLGKFLQAKYNVLKPEITRQIKAGSLVEQCNECNFVAARVEGDGVLFSGECMVCGVERTTLHVSCPNCTKTIVVEELGEGTCENCEETIDIDYVREQFVKAEGSGEGYGVAYCGHCKRTDTELT